MTDTKPDKRSQSRRKILRSLVAGGGAVTSSKMLPDAWTKPVVEAVLIPAHAQTSGRGRIQGVFRTMGPIGGMGMGMHDNFGDSKQLIASAKENDEGVTSSVMDFFILPLYSGKYPEFNANLGLVPLRMDLLTSTSTSTKNLKLLWWKLFMTKP